MPKGEFENRDRDEASDLGGIPLAGVKLGELPDDLARERGDLRTFSIDTGASQNPDLYKAREARDAARDTGLGSPVMDYTVRSVYDSRPNSARDFNQWYTSRSDNPNHNPNDFTGMRRCFTVPQGWVAVIRKVSFRMDPSTVMAGTPGDSSRGAWYDALIKLLVNGACVDPEVFTTDVGTATSLPTRLDGIPVRDGDDVETWAIADEGFSIGVDIDGYQISSGGYTVSTQPRINIGFYGNLLLKTGRPAMFEPSNLAGRALSAITSTPRDLGGIPSGENLVARQRRRLPFANVPILRK